jgi:hypothetical protein
VALYRIPASDPAPYANLYLPREGVAWTERDGWILGDARSFYMALRPIGAYRWAEIREEDLVDGWLLRLEGSAPGLVLEVEEADEAGVYPNFCEEMVVSRLDLSGWPDPGRVRFESLRGHELDILYDGPHRVDGEEIDYGAWPLVEAPGVEAPLGEGRVRFRGESGAFELDFEVDPARPMIPMRVIG